MREKVVSEGRFQGVELVGQIVAHERFLRCEFVGCVADGCSFGGCTFEECSFGMPHSGPARPEQLPARVRL